MSATPWKARPIKRKSCDPCVKAKRRCDLQTPSCSRCIKRQLKCDYVRRPDAASTKAKNQQQRQQSIRQTATPQSDRSFNQEGTLDSASKASSDTSSLHLMSNNAADSNFIDFDGSVTMGGHDDFQPFDFSYGIDPRFTAVAAPTPQRDFGGVVENLFWQPDDTMVEQQGRTPSIVPPAPPSPRTQGSQPPLAAATKHDEVWKSSKSCVCFKT